MVQELYAIPREGAARLERLRDEGELEQTCSETGVLAPVVGVIGSIQATEAIKVLTGIGDTLNGRLLLWDAMDMEWRSLKLRKDPACPLCGETTKR